MNVTAQLLIDAVGCTPDRAYLFATHLDDACDSFAINTPARLAAFLAQVGHESGSLRYVREIATGEAYEGRRDLGNVQHGDGVRYRGRGLMQITGRDNYIATTGRLVGKFNGSVPNFVDEPEALEQPRWAAISAADWWHSRGLNAFADLGEFDKISKAINVGNPESTRQANGHHDRRQRWERAKRAISALAETSQSGEPAYTSAERVEKPAEIVQATSQIGRETPEMQGYQALEDAMAGDPAEYPQPEPSMPIPAIVGALLPSLIESIPKLGSLFGSGSDVQQRNVKAAEMALQIAQTAVGATNAQETVERIKSDPQALQKATQAITDNWYQLAEAGGGGIDGARKFIAANGESSGGAVWKIVAVVTYCALGFLVLANFIALAVYVVSMFRPESSGQLTAAMQLLGTVIQADIGAALMACGFWLGSSWGSKQKAATNG